MPARNPTFSLSEQPEVFASTTQTSHLIGAAKKKGLVREIGPRLYSTNLTQPVEVIVRKNWATITSIYFPGAVIVDRSHFLARPADDGSLFLDAGPSWRSHRIVRLPGLILRPRQGTGPVEGDMTHLSGLFFSSRPRALLDNLKPSRSGNAVARTLTRDELEVELLNVVDVRGESGLNEIRDQARDLSAQLGRDAEFEKLDALVGALLGTRESTLSSAPARARGRGEGYDSRRTELFAELQEELLRTTFKPRPSQPDPNSAFAFIEAYFSNFIEGTEFELEEAEDIVFRRTWPEGRFEDAHDILGTFDLIDHPTKRSQLPRTADELLILLRSHHAVMLERRSSARPGMFKDRANRAGATQFVTPELVVGTLREGFSFLQTLASGLPRAVFAMFLISEVHPFTDGNGRMARVMMNAELTAAGEQRIVIPLSYRDNYLQTLRALSHNSNPIPLIRVLDYTQQYASEIDWTTLETAEKMLRATNAFVEPGEAERENRLLKLPSTAERAME